MTQEERDALIEECAKKAEALDRGRYAWVKDSLWANIKRDTAADIRSLKANLAPSEIYSIGDNTMEKVFRAAQLSNLHDLQAVFDAVEKALAHNPADRIIGQIETLFPNWRSYRDLIDCIECTLHDLRKDAGRPTSGDGADAKA